jgi:hypothetical protein
MSAQTPMGKDARLLLEPRHAGTLFALVLEDGHGNRPELCISDAVDQLEWLGNSAATFHRIPFVDDRTGALSAEREEASPK